MKNQMLLILAALTVLVGCKTQTTTHPDSISGGYVFTYDYEISSAAFELAIIYIDSGYRSLVHIDAIEHYSELLKAGEWEADSQTIAVVVYSYQIIGKEMPNGLDGFIEPGYIENNQAGIENMKVQINRILKELKD